jgi:hypothetical protein
VLARAASLLRLLGVLSGAFAVLLSCRALEPSNRPIDACRASCARRAARSCSDAECARGCEFILDRLIEREMNNVISCVVRVPRRCSDEVWADCAAHVGVHADGGPPAPRPPVEEE